EQRLRGQSIIDTGVRPTWFCTADKCSTGSVRTSKSRRACTPSAACWSAPSLDRPSLRNRLPARSRLPPKHYVVEIAALLFWNHRPNGAAGGGSNLPAMHRSFLPFAVLVVVHQQNELRYIGQHRQISEPALGDRRPGRR